MHLTLKMEAIQPAATNVLRFARRKATVSLPIVTKAGSDCAFYAG